MTDAKPNNDTCGAMVNLINDLKSLVTCELFFK